MLRQIATCVKFAALAALGLATSACGDRPEQTAGPPTIVFKHNRFFGDPGAFDALMREFEAQHPGIRVRAEALPSASDEQHQFYVISLRGGSADFDVLALDVIWVAEFARAGWIADVSHLLAEEESSERLLPTDEESSESVLPADEESSARLLPVEEESSASLLSAGDGSNELFEASLDAVTYEGRAYAVPWFVEAGLLYYRKDLLARHGFEPPRTWEELAETALTIVAQEADADLHGFVWQGRQYEGLVCNALEYVWSAGGDVLRDGEVVLDSAENRLALEFVGSLVPRGVSPEIVTTATEEPSRYIFGSGRAVFLRNWPYAWTLFEQPGSPVQGQVGIAPLPYFEGHSSASALGGWNLGINAHSRYPEEAAAFVRFMTSPEVQRTLSLQYGLNPARRDLYSDPELLVAQPHLEVLREALDTAHSRPVTPYYAQLSQVLQSEFSAVVTGLEPPSKALADAQREVKRIFARP